MSARPCVALFDRQRLRIAREFNGLRRVDLAERLQISASAVTQLELGQTKPTTATLAKLAFALGFPGDFFIDDGRRTRVPDDREAFFRSLRSTKQIDRDRAAAKAYLISELFQEMERYVRLPAVNVPTDLHILSNATRGDIEERALELRRRWEIGDGPVANVVRLLEANGVIVTHCIFDCKEMSSFSKWFSARPVVVLKQERDDLARLRSDAAHELGHLVLHEQPEAGNQILEEQAQCFAASFLTPAHLVGPLLPKSFDVVRYSELKQTWGVSIAALLYRARELGRMAESTYRRAMMTVSKNGWRINEPFPLSGKETVQILSRAINLIEGRGTPASSLLASCRLPSNFLALVSPEESLETVTV